MSQQPDHIEYHYDRRSMGTTWSAGFRWVSPTNPVLEIANDWRLQLRDTSSLENVCPSCRVYVLAIVVFGDRSPSNIVGGNCGRLKILM